MDANGISWIGNKVLGGGTAQTPPRPVSGTPKAPQATEVSKMGADEAAVPTQRSQAIPMPQMLSPDMPYMQQGPPPSTEPGFIPAYLTRNIGRNVRAEFVIGNSQYIDKVGKLIEVGINYFVLEDVNSRTHVMCDLYSVKFVTVLQS